MPSANSAHIRVRADRHGLIGRSDASDLSPGGCTLRALRRCGNQRISGGPDDRGWCVATETDFSRAYSHPTHNDDYVRICAGSQRVDIIQGSTHREGRPCIPTRNTDDHVVQLITVTAEAKGPPTPGTRYSSLMCRTGQFTEAWFHVDDQYALDEFWNSLE